MSDCSVAVLKAEGALLLLGNEAVARGCLEAGVKVAATYPGTPSSEVGTTLERVADKAGIYFEYSVNEKVAMEVCGAAAASGFRAFTFMKHVGLNVASDALMTLIYSGTRAGLVVMSADDPSCHSSQNEQDNRLFAKFAMMPMLEPSTPREAKEMTVEAFRLSEDLEMPVLLRTTTRVSHARGIVPLAPLRSDVPPRRFEKDPGRFVTIPANARANRLKLIARMKKALELSELSPFNFTSGRGKVGVITSGIAYTYAAEFLGEAEILKLGFTNPPPEKRIADFVSRKESVIVVEELEPYLEDEVLRIAKERGIATPIYGKRTGHLPRAFEFSPDTVLGLRSLVKVKDVPEALGPSSLRLPSRPPVLCAGCPHRATYYAVKLALGKREAVFSSDVGCYSLGIQPPLHTADFLLCMGSSVGAAGGVSQVTDQKVVAFIGDSTFFHAGVPGLINAVFNDHPFLLVILDNGTTAMTGHQPNPATGRDFGGKRTEGVDFEALVRGCGVHFVRTTDPFDIKKTKETVREALEFEGVSVVVAKHPCPLLLRKGKRLETFPHNIDQEKCVRCYTCVRKFSCPALSIKEEAVSIDPSLCIGCGCCAQVCPKGAIGVVR